MDIVERFKHLFEPELLKQIGAKAQIISAGEGKIVLDYGQIVRSIPIILSGVFKITRVDDSGKELLLYYVNANESCVMTFT